MLRFSIVLLTLALIVPAPGQAEPYFDGEPSYTDEKSRQLAEKVLAARAPGQERPVCNSSFLPR
jgi:hypothetical protein